MFACCRLEWHQDASRWHQSCQVKMKVAVRMLPSAEATSSRQATLPFDDGKEPSRRSSTTTTKAWCLNSPPACRQAVKETSSSARCLGGLLFDRNWRCQSHSETESISATSLSSALLLFVFTFLLCAASGHCSSAQSADQFCKLPMHALPLRLRAHTSNFFPPFVRPFW